MGCDIHLMVEHRKDGVWLSADKYTHEHGESYVRGEDAFYSGRNYGLFAILADVRNGRGFGGVKTGESYEPIAGPRGTPEDVSPEVALAIENYGSDGHSHSYFTLRELLDYDWTQVTQRQGWCSAIEWEQWSRYDRKYGNGPDRFCGGISGGSIEHISAHQMDALLSGKDYHERVAVAEANRNKYALAQWDEPYYKSAGSFLSETIPRLLTLAGGTQNLDDVRIVFFFDN